MSTAHSYNTELEKTDDLEDQTLDIGEIIKRDEEEEEVAKESENIQVAMSKEVRESEKVRRGQRTWFGRRRDTKICRSSPNLNQIRAKEQITSAALALFQAYSPAKER